MLLVTLGPLGCEQKRWPSEIPARYRDAGVHAQAADPPRVDPPPPRASQRHGWSFAGFSSDERRFAYTVHLAAAGFSLFTVVESATGRRVTDFLLDGDEAESRARGFVAQGGYQATPAALPDGERIEAVLDADGFRVTHHAEGKSRVLRPGEMFQGTVGHLQNPAVGLWGLSSSGRYAVLRLSQPMGRMLGDSVTFVVVEIAEKQE